MIFDNLPGALEQARGGSVRALGVTSPQRWPGVNDVPAIAETVPGCEAVVFYGMSGTPPQIVDILNKAVNDALKDPKLAARLAELRGSSQADDAGRIRQARCRRNREMAQVGDVRERVGGLNAALHPGVPPCKWRRHCGADSPWGL